MLKRVTRICGKRRSRAGGVPQRLNGRCNGGAAACFVPSARDCRTASGPARGLAGSSRTGRRRGCRAPGQGQGAGSQRDSPSESREARDGAGSGVGSSRASRSCGVAGYGTAVGSGYAQTLKRVTAIASVSRRCFCEQEGVGLAETRCNIRGRVLTGDGGTRGVSGGPVGGVSAVAGCLPRLHALVWSVGGLSLQRYLSLRNSPRPLRGCFEVRSGSILRS